MSNLRTTILRLALSLGLGFALWLFVSYTENPDRTSALGKVPVTIDNLSPGLVLVNTSTGAPLAELAPVSLTVEADKATTADLRLSDFHAYLDLTGLNAGEHTVPVNVVPTRNGISQVTTATTPDNFNVRIDEAITATVPLTVEVTGQVPFSFEQQEPRVSVDSKPLEQVQVSGPKNLVDQVATARVTASVDGRTANYESPRPLEPLNANGAVVEGVTVTPASAKLMVPIRPSIGLKRVPVIPQTVGQPANGYVVTDVAVDPQFINVTGSSGALDDFGQMLTSEIDVGGASGTLSQTVDLRPPFQIGIQPGQQITATVTVTVEPITRPFRVKLPVTVSGVNPPSGMQVVIEPQAINVALSGTAAQLGAFDAATVQATVDLSGLAPGTHALTPNIVLPAGITLDSKLPQVTVTIIAPSTPTPPAPTATPPPAATATPTDAPPDAVPATPAPVPTEPAAPDPPSKDTPAPTATATPDKTSKSAPAPTPSAAPDQSGESTPLAPTKDIVSEQPTEDATATSAP